MAKLRVWKSVSFLAGLVLFVAAFVIVLLAGSVWNPAPYRVVIVREDVAPYTVLSADMLGVDEQKMSSRVASRLVHESEVGEFLGGLVVEALHAGEPLRTNAVVAAENRAIVHRLSLALEDPNFVAAVIPVQAGVLPQNVVAGDYINITMGLGRGVGESSSSGTSGAGGPYAVQPGGVLTGTDAGSAGLGEISTPLDKIVLAHVEVLEVSREAVANPSYGLSDAEDPTSLEPAFIEGDIEAVTILVPAGAEELLFFAVDNGTLHMSIVPHAAVLAGAEPSTGITWDDVVRFIQEERAAALSAEPGGEETPYLEDPAETITGTEGTELESPEETLTTTSGVTGTETVDVVAQASEPSLTATAVAVSEAVSGAGAASGEANEASAVESARGFVEQYGVPCAGGLGVVLVVAVALVARRRGKKA